MVARRRPRLHRRTSRLRHLRFPWRTSRRSNPRQSSTASRCSPPTSTEGRAPGTKGEELTVQYLETELKKLGLKPGNTDGTYIQKVPLVGITAAPAKPLTIAKDGSKQVIKWRDEMVAWTKHVADSASIEDSD